MVSADTQGRRDAKAGELSSEGCGGRLLLYTEFCCHQKPAVLASKGVISCVSNVITVNETLFELMIYKCKKNCYFYERWLSAL
jgi:hypothetical protein